MLITLAIFVVLSMTVFFNVQNIEVHIADSTGRYSEEDVKNVCGIEVNENMWRLNLRQKAENIEKNLYYLTDAKITRNIPSTIVIEVSEAKPAGLIEVQGSYAAVSTWRKGVRDHHRPDFHRGPRDYRCERPVVHAGRRHRI